MTDQPPPEGYPPPPGGSYLPPPPPGGFPPRAGFRHRSRPADFTPPPPGAAGSATATRPAIRRPARCGASASPARLRRVGAGAPGSSGLPPSSVRRRSASATVCRGRGNKFSKNAVPLIVASLIFGLIIGELIVGLQLSDRLDVVHHRDHLPDGDSRLLGMVDRTRLRRSVVRSVRRATVVRGSLAALASAYLTRMSTSRRRPGR